jgi:stearoyl-CoA desaturase (delta-9 desaturase)
MHTAIVGVIAGLAIAQVAILITTIYLHRSLSHKAVTFDRRIALFFRFLLWITTGIRPRQWVAVHRKHHAFTDIPGDPHSPVLLGFYKVQFGNVYYYRKEALRSETVAKYAKDLQPDRWDEILFDHSLVGLAIGISILILVGGWRLALVASIIHIVAYLGLSGAINAVGHSFGKRPYDNLATNNTWLALMTFGEGLHNNHHAAPTAAKLSFDSKEIDLAWPIISLLVRLHLATVRLSAPKFKRQTAR